jgi:hypothetical protein
LEIFIFIWNIIQQKYSIFKHPADLEEIMSLLNFLKDLRNSSQLLYLNVIEFLFFGKRTLIPEGP